jgi:hypothetical protein
MLLRELTQSLDEKQVWARSGKKVVRKYRCTGGKRHGRIVAKPQQCFASPNIKASVRLKKTKARLGKRMARKALKTKRTNPASIKLRSLNRRPSARRR